MLKQILAKLPRKSSKTSPLDSVENNSCSNYANLENGVPFTNSCNVLPNRLNVVKRISSAIFPISVTSGGEPVEPRVPFKDVSNADKQRLFMLLELSDFVASGSAKFGEAAIAAVCKMCAAYLFREFPPKHKSQSTPSETEDDEPSFDPAWWHLEVHRSEVHMEVA
ncbi:hypothetical protein LIER_24074 [Lithospermum erythrorhizon]|uniref:Uncharacterized protein n=1 Tax=Lithospermum erythrorhizon TaxID=34254 RepID=A0AAV3R1B3_LITER